MITLICGTNRPNNQSQKFINTYKKLLKKRNVDCQEVFLEHLPTDLAFSNAIIGTSTKELQLEIDKKIIPIKKIVVVVPEYNGSYPGILKSFIDCIEPKYYRGKIIALVGISAGRSGNIRGMDHLTGVFHYLGAEVLSTKVDVANIHTILDEQGELNNEDVARRMERQIDQLLKVV